MRRCAFAIAVVLASTGVPGEPVHAIPRLAIDTTAPSLAIPAADEPQAWQHYYRRHGKTYWRRYYLEPQPAAPVRPLSCGEFRFWDGQQCVDVRFSAPAAGSARRSRARR